MTLIAGLVAIITLYLLSQTLRTANPTLLARMGRKAGGVACLAIAAFTGIRGELAVAIPLGLFGAGLLGWSAGGLDRIGLGGLFGGGGSGSGGARSQLIELAPDRRDGRLAGRFIGGPYAGHSLDEFEVPQLAGMIANLDAGSAALLESYLDRRFPTWRQHAQRDAAGRQRRAAASTKMTEEEAYQILGLQAGAGRDEIGRAHRALMKKLHPDQGGSTYLAARVNEAKDTLLRTHHG
jgi:DnaJ domain